MTRKEIKERFHNLTVWKRGDERAPHKPLLVLYALGRLQRGKEAAVPYREVDSDLRELLRTFGPPRKALHPEYPFWRLQNDGIWVIDGAGQLVVRESSTDARKSELVEHDVSGGFTPAVHRALRRDPVLLREIAADLLDNHFPRSLHEEILSAVGLDLSPGTSYRAKRDPAFRERVLAIYEHRCAVCGFDVRLGQVSIALDAAHIKWRQAGGPDKENNGLALCTMHHKTFDLGAYTVGADYRIRISERAHGTCGFNEWLLKYHGQLVRNPIDHCYSVAAEFLAWHRREVFRGPERPVSRRS